MLTARVRRTPGYRVAAPVPPGHPDSDADSGRQRQYPSGYVLPRTRSPQIDQEQQGHTDRGDDDHGERSFSAENNASIANIRNTACRNGSRSDSPSRGNRVVVINGQEVLSCGTAANTRSRRRTATCRVRRPGRLRNVRKTDPTTPSHGGPGTRESLDRRLTSNG